MLLQGLKIMAHIGCGGRRRPCPLGLRVLCPGPRPLEGWVSGEYEEE